MSAPPIDHSSGQRRADSSDADQPSVDGETTGGGSGEPVELRERISELETALDRKESALAQKDAEIDAVRRRYEALLEDAPAGSDHSGAGLLSRFL